MKARLVTGLLALGLFALVLGLKFETVHRYGSDLPVWDQWDAEGLNLLAPWSEGRLGLDDLFRAHNEHRVVLTKLLTLGTTVLNGQWDARLQCAVNAALHSAFAALLLVLGCRGLAVRWHAAWFILVAVLTGLPLAWQNVLAGFHSQQYFLLLLSLGAIRLLPAAAPLTWRWWIGAGCALLALFSMASGLLAAAVIVGLALLLNWKTKGSALAWPTIAAGALVALAGWLFQIEVSYHAGLKARSVPDFLLYAVHSLQWPSPDHSWLALIGWLPLALLLARFLRRRAEADEDAFALTIIGLGGWVFLQILASAYARGAEGGMPASRYMDTLALGMLANALALGWLLDRSAGRVRLALGAFGAGWLVALGLGLHALLAPIYERELPATRDYLAQCEQTVRAYLRTGNPAVLAAGPIPYPSASALRERLDLPALRDLLPVSARLPVALDDAAARGGFRFLDNIRRPRNPSLPPEPAKDPASLLPAGLSPPGHSRLWSSFGATAGGVWRSRPVRFNHAARLHFQAAGNSPASLELHDALSGHVVSSLSDAISAASWQEVTLTVPRGEFVLHARPGGGASWLAFTEPVEEGRLSRLASRLVARGRTLWIGAAIFSAGVLVALGLSARRREAAEPKSCH